MTDFFEWIVNWFGAFIAFGLMMLLMYIYEQIKYNNLKEKVMNIFYNWTKPRKNKVIHPTQEEELPQKRVVKEIRPFTQQEKDAVEKAVVVSASMRNSARFFITNGGSCFMPMDLSCPLQAGETINVEDISLIIWQKKGEADMITVTLKQYEHLINRE